MTDTTQALSIDDEAERRRIVNRLRRLEGQVRGLQSMIVSDKECEAILTQVMAAKSALNQVGMHVIGYAMKNCLVDTSLTDRSEIIASAFGVYLNYRELGCAGDVSPPADTVTPEQVISLLKLLETEVNAVQSVLSSNGDCKSALRELTAANCTLNAVGLAVLGHAMQRCLIDDHISSREDVIDAAIAVFLRYSSCVS